MQIIIINSQKGGSGKTMLASISPLKQNVPAMVPCS